MDLRNENADVKKIFLCCFVGKSGGERIHKNRSSYGLAFYISGEKNYCFERKDNYTVPLNSVIFLPKHSNYVVDTIIAGSCYAINFDLSEDIDFPPFVLKIKNHAEILESFKTANSSWKKKEEGYEMKCRSCLYNIIYIIQKEYHNYYNTKQLKKIEPALNYIKNSFQKKDLLSVSELSKMCGISETYFRRLFQKCLGVSPIQYINNQKLTYAAELLYSNCYNVHSAMEQSGFEDESYFSRSFKKHFGVSPSEYANKTE